MENKPQVASPQKSPVPTEKSDLSTDEAQSKQSSSASATNKSASEQSSEHKKEHSNSTYQESSKSETSKNDQEPLSDSKNTKDTTASSEETLPHPIISIDIQKNMPYDNKNVVPPSEKEVKSDVNLSPEVVASVVTTAVVTEAALTVGGTDGLVINGDKLNSSSSNVDAVVEQALNKISESMSGKVETKTDSDSKPIPNGDIDHSPVLDEKSANKSELLKQDLSIESSTQENSSKDSKNGDIVTKDNNTCNGVPGIITVESISKKETKVDVGEAKNFISTSDATSKDIEDNKPSAETVVNDAKKDETSKTVLEASVSDNAEIDSKKIIANAHSESKQSADKKDSTEVKVVHENLTDSAKLNKIHDKKEDSEKERSETATHKDVLDTSSKETDIAADKEKEKTPTALQSTTQRDQNKEEHTEDITKKSDKNKNESSVDEKSDKKVQSAVPCENISPGTTQGDVDETSKTKDSEVESADNSSKPEKVNTTLETDIKEGKKQELVSEAHEISASEMEMMMTSQILTPEQLNTDDIEESVTKVSTNEREERAVSSDVKKDESCRISASRISPVTCDVGVGIETPRTIRVASGDAGEEEIDGQETSTEIEVTEDSNVDGTNLVEDGAPSPTAASPSTDQSPSPSKTSQSSSKASSAVSRKDTESVKEEETKPSSAVSRSSIPEPIVYEPPERRRSATSVASEDKKDDESDKSQQDEKETEKTEGNSEKELKKDEDIEEVKEEPEAVDESVDVKSELNKDEKDNKGEELPTDKTDAVKMDSGNEVGRSQEILEKGVEDEKEKESEKGKEETHVTVEIHERPVSIVSVEITESDSVVIEDAKDAQEDAQEQSDTKDEAPTPETTITDAKENETIEASAEAGEDKADEIKTDADGVEEEKDEGTKDAGEQDAEIEKSEEADKPECIEIVSKAMDEPKTLVEEESKLEESSEKEKETEEKDEKEEDETEKDLKETTPEDTAAELSKAGEDEAEKDDKADQVAEEIGEIEVKKDEEMTSGEEKDEATKTDGKIEDSEQNEEEEKKDESAEQAEEKEETKAEVEDEEQTKDDEKADDAEEQKEDAKDEEADETPEPPPKSPTRRMRSPDKAGRRGSLPQLRLPPKVGSGWGGSGLCPIGRISPKSSQEGVSPASSPPKPIKTPPSPQKPPKSTSPKKKNGMLSPIKTPKTPGSDIRKLPPIKAPVGLAPNPNLKNIRSKIGSFDNIRYKPGGGDKKVISKKLDWKAAPKIGSLDHSFKSGEKKHGKSHSKGDIKEGKLVDGQSPLPSGDEGEQDGVTTEIAEKLGAASVSPAAIAAES